MIPLFKVWMNPRVDERLSKILHSGFIGQGAVVDEFEARLREYLGVPYIVTVNSGTAALHLAYRLAGINPFDTVMSTPMTCAATNMPILERKGLIHWLDVNSSDGNVNPESIRPMIRNFPKAIVCVHYGGYPCDMDEIIHKANIYGGITVIEDAAHAFGAEYRGKKIGSHGDFIAFSFQAIKALTTIDGGALVCKNADDYRRAKLLRWYGMDREDKTRLELRCEADVSEYGYKFHMNDVNAAVGIANLEGIEERISICRDNASFYDAILESNGTARIRMTARDPMRQSSFWLYPVLVDDPARFVPFMKSRGVHCSPVHLRNDIHSCFGRFQASLPGVDLWTSHQISIPVGWWVDPPARDLIASAMLDYDRGISA